MSPAGARVVSDGRQPVDRVFREMSAALKGRQEEPMSSFTRLSYHLVFSTKHRQPLIDAAWQQRLFDYIGGIVRQQGGVLLAAGGMPDHVHLLATISKSVAIADGLRDIKANASKWVHEEIPNRAAFAWQSGYAAFTVSYSGLDSAGRYLAGQKEHHRVRTFQEEFLELLRRHEVAFDGTCGIDREGCRPFRALCISPLGFQGLAPLANDTCPFGAEAPLR
jgi:REP element-mobilizing transposase RayT